MAAKRILAVLMAVGLVTGAWLVRTKVIDKKSTGTPTTTGAGTASSGRARSGLGCLDALKEVCAKATTNVVAMATQVADAPATDAFVTLSPWDEQPGGWVRTPLASTAVVLLGRNDKLDELRAACPGYQWSCIGEKADIRFADPIRSADGAIAFASALAGRLGTTQFGTGDISVKPADGTWANTVRGERKPPSDPAKLNVGAAFDITATLMASAAKGSLIRIERPEPQVVTTAVLVTKGAPEAKIVGDLRQALRNNGWDDGVTTSGLPDATAVEAARAFWTKGS